MVQEHNFRFLTGGKGPFSGRNGINSTGCPGVTPQDAPHGQAETAEGSVSGDRFQPVGGAGRIIPAHIPIEWGYDFTVGLNKPNQNILRQGIDRM